MTPYEAMRQEGVSEDVARNVLQRLEAQREPTSWTPARPYARSQSKQEQDAFAERLRVRDEAYMLLDLVAAEFRTDPTSVQCFDAHTVKRVIYIAALTKAGLG